MAFHSQSAPERSLFPVRRHRFMCINISSIHEGSRRVDDLDRCDSGRKNETLVVGMRHDQSAHETRADAPRRCPEQTGIIKERRCHERERTQLANSAMPPRERCFCRVSLGESRGSHHTTCCVPSLVVYSTPKALPKFCPRKWLVPVWKRFCKSVSLPCHDRTCWILVWFVSDTSDG